MRQPEELARIVLSRCAERDLMLATAESCTGGLVAAELTAIEGSSRVFERGFVTYSNAAKMDMLAVPEDVIAAAGAVSAQTALAMATGAVHNSRADLAVSVTGIAGPGGGSVEKPVGLVWFALARKGGTRWAEHRLFDDDGRAAIRRYAVVHALQMLLKALELTP